MTGHRAFGGLTKSFSPARMARVKNKAAAAETALALHELRKSRKVSQEVLAQKLAVGQPAVAKLERRSDMYVGNLRRYVEGLGGTLEITAISRRHRNGNGHRRNKGRKIGFGRP